MSLSPCLRCGQPVPDDEMACSSCGQVRGAPLDETPSEPPPPSSAPAPGRRSFQTPIIVAVSALAGFAAFDGWASLHGRAPAARPAPVPLAAGSPTAGKTPPLGAEAAPPPTPKNIPLGSQVLFGVVYDLETKEPIRNTRVSFLPSAAVNWAMTSAPERWTKTDSHGWYRVDIYKGAFAAGVAVDLSEPGYRPGALQERAPPLASRPLEQREALAANAGASLRPILVRFAAMLPWAELNLALVPADWPANASAQARSAPVSDPSQKEAELPPPQQIRWAGSQNIYGVVYDLATKRPVWNAAISFVTGGHRSTSSTDARGWYRIDFNAGAFSRGVDVYAYARGYEQGALQDRDPPLAGRSAVERRTISEEEGPSSPVKITLPIDSATAELDLAMVPSSWPAGMPPARVDDATDPPVPDEPNQYNCRYYGVVYDLATKKPLRALPFILQGTFSQTVLSTDGLGRYLVDTPYPHREPEGPALSARAPGYRPGLLADQYPPMRQLNVKKRRDIADTTDLGFDPVPMPDDCDEGVVRLDLVAVPEKWPGL